MLSINPQDFLYIVLFTLYAFGCISTISGIIVLIKNAMGKQVSSLAVQTANLVKKGIAEDIAGLVGNASSLLDAINQMVKNTAGIGVFLIISGLLFFVAAGLLTIKIYMG
jgi:hypothetical protein